MRTDGLQTVALPSLACSTLLGSGKRTAGERGRAIALLLALPTMGQGLPDADAGLSTRSVIHYATWGAGR